MFNVQFEGVILLGPDPGSLTDYSDEIASFVINEGRAVTQKAPSFGSPALRQMAAADTAQVSVVYAVNPGGALQTELRAAKATVSGDLYFDVSYHADPVDSSHPRYVGWVTVIDLDTGGTSGEFRIASKTWPAHDVSEQTV